MYSYYCISLVVLYCSEWRCFLNPSLTVTQSTEQDSADASCQLHRDDGTRQGVSGSSGSARTLMIRQPCDLLAAHCIRTVTHFPFLGCVTHSYEPYLPARGVGGSQGVRTEDNAVLRKWREQPGWSESRASAVFFRSPFSFCDGHASDFIVIPTVRLI